MSGSTTSGIPESLAKFEGKKALVIASTGGHLSQALKWSRRLSLDANSRFVTFESMQTDSLLAGRSVSCVPYVKPRDYTGVIRASRLVSGILAEESFDFILSTGAGLALSGLAGSQRRRIPFVYIESVSRFFGPSLTGSFMAKVPSVTTFSQHDYKSKRWTLVPSLLDSYNVSEELRDKGALRVLVSLGTIRPYRFDRMVDYVLPSLEREDSVTWQLGVTDRCGLPGRSESLIPSRELQSLSAQSDVVVTHAGVGTIMDLLDLGKFPLVVARSKDRGEHVDDHQAQIARHLEARGLAHVVTGPITREMLLTASRKVVSGA